jgi:hypothetical protein
MEPNEIARIVLTPIRVPHREMLVFVDFDAFWSKIGHSFFNHINSWGNEFEAKLTISDDFVIAGKKYKAPLILTHEDIRTKNLEALQKRDLT